MSKQDVGKTIILGWDNAPGEGSFAPYQVLEAFDLKEEFERFNFKRIQADDWEDFIHHLLDKKLIGPADVRCHILNIFIDDIKETDFPRFYDGYVSKEKP